uniref:RING-type domain-containing protein n=1 Tax=viral metagenome TaxID=1070528 RepID=A0A6C0ENN4_9ZZZZ
MDPCVLCFEDMDMIRFQDTRKSTITCVKLQCGHAYHTECIVNCLSVSNFGCPTCNKQKTPCEELTREGLAKKLVGELKKEDDIKFLINEFKESSLEYNEAISTLKKDTKAFISKRSEELQLADKRKYMLDCLTKLQSTARSISKTKGPQYSGALNIRVIGRYRRGTPFERLFFSIQEAYRIYRLKTPTLYMPLY